MPSLRHACLWIAALGIVGCGDGGLISNPMLDRWCGDRPCAWNVSGRIKRVGTWHTNDYAVELLGSDTTLSQVNAEVDEHDSTCLGFSMIADVASRARVFVELDFLDDGSVEFSQGIPESHWERRTFLIRTPSWYEGVRFIVRKAGSGRVVLAELRARPDAGCTAPAVRLLDRPDGARCEEDEQCKTGQCTRGKCAFCADGTECPPGSICGIAAKDGNLAERCVKPGSAVFGESCATDAQCATGTCCEGVCSQCCPDAAGCQNGARCARTQVAQAYDRVVLPYQCAPGEERTLSLGPCVEPRDCQSRSCTDVRVSCTRCSDSEDAGVEADSGPCGAACSEWSLRGGVCD